MNRRYLIAAALFFLSSVATAQRTRTQSDRRTELFVKDSSRQSQVLRGRDVEDQSPPKLLIDKRKDLKLTDARLSQLKDSEGKLKEKNAPLLRAIDSLVHEMRSGMRSWA